MKAIILAASVLLVTADSVAWRSLRFDGIAPNRVAFDQSAIILTIDGSGSPLIRPLPDGPSVRRIEITGKVTGSLEISSDRLWKEGFDDAFLRFGVIEAGRHRLSTLQRSLVPDWLKECDDLLSADDRGIDAIHCGLLMPERAGWIGRTRKFGPANVIRERVAAAPEGDGAFQMTLEFDPPVVAAGLWISADGDDTDSAFRVVIDRVSLF